MTRAYSEQDQKPQFWFNLKSGEVEVGPQSLSQDRIGPFKTFAEAERALLTVAERERERQREELKEENNW